MEIIIFWIVGAIIWGVISEFTSGDKKSDPAPSEENTFKLKVETETPPKEDHIKEECFAIKMKGPISHPTDNRIKLSLSVSDNTEKEDSEWGLPCISAHPAFCEKKSRVLAVEAVLEVEKNKYYPDWAQWAYIPKSFITPPYKGKRKLKFSLALSDSDSVIHQGAFEDTNKVIYHDYQIVNFNFKEIGYMDEIVNKDKINDITIQLAMAMAASDNHLDQKELNVIKNWAKGITSLLDVDKAKERNKHFSTFIKKTYLETKQKKISLSKLVKNFNEVAGKSQKYTAIELLLEVAQADGNLGKEEDSFINKIAKTTGIDLSTFKEMRNKIIANVDTIDLADNNTEQNFGLTDEMTNIEKCKALRKEYTKWSGQTAHKDKKKKKRAKEMVNIIANLRKKYDC